MSEKNHTDGIDAVIVNYNAGRFLQACINSLVNGGIQRCIVVDNASEDDSLDQLGDFLSSNIIIVRNHANLGFAAACNQGIRESSTSRILFINPDCVLGSNSLLSLNNTLDQASDIGIVGGNLVNEDGTEQAGGRRTFPTPWRSFIRVFGLHTLASWRPDKFSDFHLHKQPLPDTPIEIEAISGACMLAKREAIDDVGLWDEGYFLHCEDLDWCMRFHQKGWKIMFVPDANVTHAGGACSKSRPIFVEWHKHRGMQRFYRKFYKDKYPFLLWPAVVMAVWLRFSAIACYYAVLRLLGSERLSRA